MCVYRHSACAGMPCIFRQGCSYPRCGKFITHDTYLHSNGHKAIPPTRPELPPKSKSWEDMSTVEKLRYIGHGNLAAEFLSGQEVNVINQLLDEVRYLGRYD